LTEYPCRIIRTVIESITEPTRLKMKRSPKIYTAMLNVKVTPDQKEQIRSAATAVGATLGVYVRNVLLEKSRRVLKAA
jgi:uncharacterized protein (DUF1778 family)